MNITKEEFLNEISKRICDLKARINGLNNSEEEYALKLTLQVELTKVMIEFGKLMFTE